MSVTTLTSKGQMTLPKDVRDDLQVKPGDKIEFVKVSDHYVVRPRRKRSAMELYGILHREGETALTIEEMDEALGEALREDDERIRAGR